MFSYGFGSFKDRLIDSAEKLRKLQAELRSSASLSSQMQELVKENLAMRTDIDGMQGEISTLSSWKSAEEKRSAALEDEVAALKGQLKAEQEANAELRYGVLEKSREFEALQNELQGLRTEKEKLRSKCGDLQGNCIDLQSKVFALKEKLREWEARHPPVRIVATRSNKGDQRGDVVDVESEVNSP